MARTSPRSWLWVSPLFCACWCSVDSGNPRLSVPSRVVVGTSVRGTFAHKPEFCIDYEKSKPSDCVGGGRGLESVVSSDPAVLRVDDVAVTGFGLTALAEGDVTLTVTGNTGGASQTLTADVATRIPNGITLEPAKTCTQGTPIPVGDQLSRCYTYTHDGTPLVGSSPGAFSTTLGTVEDGPVSTDRLNPGCQNVLYKATEHGVATVTNRHAPAFTWTIDVFDNSDVAAFEVGMPAAPFPPRSRQTLSNQRRLIDGGVACATGVGRTELETPDVCRNDNNYMETVSVSFSAYDGPKILSLIPGTCSFRAYLNDDTAHVAHVSFEIVPPDAGSADGG